MAQSEEKRSQWRAAQEEAQTARRINERARLKKKKCLFSSFLSPQDENQGGEEGERRPEADRRAEKEESVEAGRAAEERPEEAHPLHKERGELPVLPTRQPGLQIPHHGPQGGPAAAAHVHTQVGQEEQGAQVRHQVHEVPPVSHLPHRLPVTAARRRFFFFFHRTQHYPVPPTPRPLRSTQIVKKPGFNCVFLNLQICYHLTT